MCTVCGCNEGETRLDIGHSHSHDHAHQHHGDIHYGHGPAHSHAPGMSQSRMVQIEKDIVAKNNNFAALNRQFFREHNILCLNLVSSPGSGKTTLLTNTLNSLQKSHKVSVIEGDQQTTNDAEKIRATGVKAIQINTGKGCHLDAHQVGHAVESLAPEPDSTLFIENVGNLVCPASFDLGERAKVVILSVTEGEDKPLKYPDMFHAAELVIINKTDLLPYLEFDLQQCISNIRRINPDAKIIKVSSTTMNGFEDWFNWLELQSGGSNRF